MQPAVNKAVVTAAATAAAASLTAGSTRAVAAACPAPFAVGAFTCTRSHIRQLRVGGLNLLLLLLLLGTCLLAGRQVSLLLLLLCRLQGCEEASLQLLCLSLVGSHCCRCCSRRLCLCCCQCLAEQHLLHTSTSSSCLRLLACGRQHNQLLLLVDGVAAGVQHHALAARLQYKHAGSRQSHAYMERAQHAHQLQLTLSHRQLTHRV